VEELLDGLSLIAPVALVVDPPRSGLHPKAASALASMQAEVLVYVACNPASLGRDRAILEAGGWTLDALWTVDLFPQTRHVEAVARFIRPG
jgi:23S rRNA (uracil1939-C5)-methyltransferase